MRIRKMTAIGAAAITAGIVCVALVGLIVVVLWNALMPEIFGLPSIGYWQAVGLLVLSRLLFGGFFRGWRRGMGRPRFVRGWSNLTPEERQRFRDAMGKHCPERFREEESTGKSQE